MTKMDDLAETLRVESAAIEDIVNFVERGRRAQDAVTRASWPLEYVISGFQTGADQAGSRAGKRCGYRTGGMMPKGFLTEDGPRPDLAESYGAVESTSADWAPRTRWNVRNSTGTLIFVRSLRDVDIDGGSLLTAGVCAAHHKPHLLVRWIPNTMPACLPGVDDIRAWIITNTIRTLNIAGNRESKSPGIGVAVEALCLEILRTP